jgi:hypothetical protein
MSKSRALIVAAIAGSLQNVKLLLKDYHDINAVVNDDEGSDICALTVSMAHKQWHVAKYLIDSGSKLEKKDAVYYTKPETLLYGYPYAVVLSDINEECFSLILKYIENINPSIPHVGDDAIRIIPVVEYLNLCWLNIQSDASRIKLCYILSKAVITANAAVIEQFHDVLKTMKFNLDIFKKHLNGYDSLGPNDVRNAIKTLPLFTEIAGDSLSKNDIQEIQSLLESKLKFEISRAKFPNELRRSLISRPSRSLHEMVCELLYWVFPDEFPIPQPAKSVNEPKNKAIDIEKLAEKQNISSLLRMLELDPAEIVTRLLVVCTNDLKDDNNPAILLLAQILYFHHADQVDGKPIFTPYQLSDALSVINNYFQMKPSERVLLRINHQNLSLIGNLRAENNQQKMDLTALQVQHVTMEKKIDRLTGAVERLAQSDSVKHKKRPRSNSGGLLFG